MDAARLLGVDIQHQHRDGFDDHDAKRRSAGTSVSTSDQGQIGTDDAGIRAVKKALFADQVEAAGKLGASPL